jgi:hypothetical protein
MKCFNSNFLIFKERPCLCYILSYIIITKLLIDLIYYILSQAHHKLNLTIIFIFPIFEQITMSNWLKLSLLLVLAAAATTANDESASAKLLFSKQILNKYLVEGMDILIKYVSY